MRYQRPTNHKTTHNTLRRIKYYNSVCQCIDFGTTILIEMKCVMGSWGVKS